jgi:predicted permease
MDDLRFALRMLWKHPGFTVVAVLTLAAGTGLNTAMFSIMDQSNLQDLPVHEPGRLHEVKCLQPNREPVAGLSFGHFRELREHCRSFADVAAYRRDAGMIADYLAEPRTLTAGVVSRNYFALLGIQPAAGRFFSDTDDAVAQAEPAVVISYNLWQRDFGGEPGVVGKTIQLTGRPLRVVGVAPKPFVGLVKQLPEEVWLPVETWKHYPRGRFDWPGEAGFKVLGRLKPEVPAGAAQAEAETLLRSLTESERESWRVGAVELSPCGGLRFKGGAAYWKAWWWMILPGMVWLVAGANVSSLLLARSQTRRHELAVKLALGSSRLRLIGGLLTESLLLCLAGGAAGMLLACWALYAMPALFPFVAAVDHYLNWHALAFTVGLSLASTLLFGLLPAWRASRPGLAPLLKQDRDQSRGRFWGLSGLVVGQLALSLVMLCVMGLYLSTFVRCLRAPLGFRITNLLVADVNLEKYDLDEVQAQGYWQQLLAQLRALPAFKQVSVTSQLPLSFQGGGFAGGPPIRIPKSAANDSERTYTVDFNLVDEGYFRALGTRMLRGREFQASDDKSGAPVAILNQSAAKLIWPNEDPIGKRFWREKDKTYEVVGIVEDSVWGGFAEQPRPFAYYPLWQFRPWIWNQNLVLLLQTEGNPRALSAAVLQVMRRVNERVRPSRFTTLAEHVRRPFDEMESSVDFFAAFGGLALALAAVGLYAVVAFAVNRRTYEIGVRMALGANRQAVLWMVLERGLKLAVMGALIGLPGAWGATRMLRSINHDLAPAHPLIFGSVALVLVAVALLASLLPARRAARVDPMAALRYE